MGSSRGSDCIGYDGCDDIHVVRTNAVCIGYPDDNHQHQDDRNTFHVKCTYVSSPSTGWSGFVMCGVVVA